MNKQNKPTYSQLKSQLKQELKYELRDEIKQEIIAEIKSELDKQKKQFEKDIVIGFKKQMQLFVDDYTRKDTVDKVYWKVELDTLKKQITECLDEQDRINQRITKLLFEVVDNSKQIEEVERSKTNVIGKSTRFVDDRLVNLNDKIEKNTEKN